ILLECSTYGNAMNSAQAFGGVKRIINGAGKVLGLIVKSRSDAKSELVLIERITSTKGRHVIPKIFGSEIVLLRSIGVRREIKVDVQLLVFHFALKNIAGRTNSEDQW